MSAAAWAVLSSVRAETEASPGPLSNQRGENCTCRAGQASKAGDRGLYIKSQYPSTSLPLSNYLPFGCSLCSSLLLSSPPLRWGYWSWMSPHLSDVEELLCCSFSDTHSPRSQKSLSSLLLLSLPSPLLPLPFPTPSLSSPPSALQHIQACLFCYLENTFHPLYIQLWIFLLLPFFGSHM